MSLRSRKPADAAPNRMGALAKLPVFFELTAKRVVMAGGTAAAAWKAELLAAAGASVHIYATH
ncbi:MAG: NAD(P)-dependent oxidoreductase, partial [Pseudomonadota bacterium]